MPNPNGACVKATSAMLKRKRHQTTKVGAITLPPQ